MNKWQQLIRYMHYHDRYDIITRADLFQSLPGVRKKWQTQKHYTLLDTYRKILEKAGYLVYVDRGVYCLKKEIPLNLSYVETKYKAYPRCKPCNKSNQGYDPVWEWEIIV